MYELSPAETALNLYNLVALPEMKTPLEGMSPVMMQYEN
jgi:hypothetical protein